MPAVFAQGSSGKSIRRFQSALTKFQVPKPGGGTEPALALDQVNGLFGSEMRKAIQRVQKSKKLPETGVMDKTLWEAINGVGSWPNEYEICLGLLGSFEGHDYTKAAGNYDQAGITWGIIGFTLIGWKDKKKTIPVFNSLHKLLMEIDAANPGILDKAFGVLQGQTIEKLLAGKPEDFYKFANDISTAKGARLLPSWQAGFDMLGRDERVQKLQEDFAAAEYYDPAMKVAKQFESTYDMASPRTRQLFFDIQVNNGGLGTNETKEAEKVLAKLGVDDPDATLEQKLLAITNVLATSRKKHAKDIRARKGTISNGSGEVHRKAYDLDGWGLEREEAPLPLNEGLMLLNFTDQVEEQKILAEAAATMTGREHAAEMWSANIWPEGNGTSFLSTANGFTLSLKGLFEPADSSLIQPESEPLRHAVGLMFKKPISVLALFGQSAPEEMAGRGMLFGRQGSASVGLSIGEAGEFSLMRHRLVGESPESSVLDVPEATRSLGSCQLVMLYSGYGVAVKTFSGCPAHFWKERLNSLGADPIVVGWRGNTRAPRDAMGRFVSKEFFDKVKAIDPAATLEQLCNKHEEEVIQAWGLACWKAFSAGSQRFLWHDPGIFGLDFTKSGAAAVARNGQVWIANSSFDGIHGKSMEMAA
jgi:Putative peptidoglycan binding domain